MYIYICTCIYIYKYSSDTTPRCHHTEMMEDKTATSFETAGLWPQSTKHGGRRLKFETGCRLPEPAGFKRSKSLHSLELSEEERNRYQIKSPAQLYRAVLLIPLRTFSFGSCAACPKPQAIRAHSCWPFSQAQCTNANFSLLPDSDHKPHENLAIAPITSQTLYVYTMTKHQNWESHTNMACGLIQPPQKHISTAKTTYMAGFSWEEQRPEQTLKVSCLDEGQASTQNKQFHPFPSSPVLQPS